MFVKRNEKEGLVECLYDSSNVVASSYDKTSGDLTVTFKNGGQYTYNKVASRDYIRFEMAESQGKVMNSHIKSYSFIKKDNVNVENLIKEIKSYIPKRLSQDEEVFLIRLKEIITDAEATKEISVNTLQSLNDELGKLILTYAQRKDGE